MASGSRCDGVEQKHSITEPDVSLDDSHSTQRIQARDTFRADFLTVPVDFSMQAFFGKVVSPGAWQEWS